MPSQSVEAVLERVEARIRAAFPSDDPRKRRLEFVRQRFARHIELWVYTLKLDDYEPVKELCEKLSRDEDLDQLDPEVWLLVKTWTGHWPGGESEQELRRRREEFRRRHNLPVP